MIKPPKTPKHSSHGTDGRRCPAETSGWQRALWVMPHTESSYGKSLYIPKKNRIQTSQWICFFLLFFLSSQSQRELTHCMGGKLGLQPVEPLGEHRTQEPLGKGLQVKPALPHPDPRCISNITQNWIIWVSCGGQEKPSATTQKVSL